MSHTELSHNKARNNRRKNTTPPQQLHSAQSTLHGAYINLTQDLHYIRVYTTQSIVYTIQQIPQEYIM